MTYEQWERVKEECHNAKMVAFAGLSKEAQEAMREACKFMWASVDGLNWDGSWSPVNMPGFYPGNTYRINPSWSGPSKTELVEEYEDVPVRVACGHYVACDGAGERALDVCRSSIRFAGYVMPDGLLAPCLIFDEQADGTYRLRVPKAVRLVKEVAK